MNDRRLSSFFRGFEQLSSSIGREVMPGEIPSRRCGFAVLKGFQTFESSSHTRGNVSSHSSHCRASRAKNVTKSVQ